ncbi:zinc ribbon domain-containing protein [Alkalihalobacillus hwajinpoensis]|uniref:zinc-ribbon domain-containing protein n=1 Tax=Guptibacillus hwajinpoensis TaxID=208199 RepID=UPI00188443F1|nr:zinc-ribbon domain-containing protein [Pseudalkalibacillus hwajinpoensis]MBF0707249.1 zinc ribbon domain-containing protein [Pseudalkalibacillus hwajinpoensis]
MYCPHCGKKRGDDEQFCFSCGKELVTQNKSKHSLSILWRWLPVMVFFLLSSTLAGYYFYEESTSKAAIRSFEKGEELAKNGKLEEAQNEFNEAQKNRPRFPAAQKNENIVTIALNVEETLKQAETARKKDNYSNALDLIKEAEQTSASYKGDLFSTLQEDIGTVRTTVMVAELKYDMKGKESIDELKPVLTRAESLQVDEAQDIAGQIRNQIVDFSINEANGYLEENHFTEALNSVEEGLEINKGNEKLSNLQTVIEKRRNSFEEEQQKRIEHAMVAAAKEEEMNRTSAIELNELETKVTDYNELKVTGTVTSKATVPVNSIGASYKVLDGDGKEFDKGEVYINPDKLYPDDTGKFDFMIYDVGEDVKDLDQFTVEIDHFTWYLD